VLLISLVVVPLAHVEAKPAPLGRGPRFEAVTFGIRHRVFHDFRELQRVKLNQEFPLGDTEFSARVVQYVPDFQMDLSTRRVFSLSDEPRNPAFKIIVRKNKVPQDTTWAFLKSPPHFGARSYFAFLVVRIDFVGHPPLLADTTAAAPPAMGSPPQSPASAAKDSMSGR
jgi:hypothetical protein